MLGLCVLLVPNRIENRNRKSAYPQSTLLYGPEMCSVIQSHCNHGITLPARGMIRFALNTRTCEQKFLKCEILLRSSYYSRPRACTSPLVLHSNHIPQREGETAPRRSKTPRTISHIETVVVITKDSNSRTFRTIACESIRFPRTYHVVHDRISSYFGSIINTGTGKL